MCDGGSGGSGGSEGDVADAAVAAAEAMSDMAGVAEAQAAEQAANAAGIGMGAAADLGGAVAAGASPADVAGAFGSGMSTNAMAENMAAGMGITGLDAMIGNIGRAYGLPPNPANANLAQAGLMATVPGMGLLGAALGLAGGPAGLGTQFGGYGPTGTPGTVSAGGDSGREMAASGVTRQAEPQGQAQTETTAAMDPTGAYQLKMPEYARGILDTAPQVTGPNILDYLQNYALLNDAFRIPSRTYDI